MNDKEGDHERINQGVGDYDWRIDVTLKALELDQYENLTSRDIAMLMLAAALGMSQQVIITTLHTHPAERAVRATMLAPKLRDLEDHLREVLDERRKSDGA